MSDKVIIQVVDNAGNFGPVIYGHWSGDDAIEAIDRLRVRMKDRLDDVEYSSARMVQELINNDDGDSGFGIWNTSAMLTEKDSQGGLSVILVNCTKDHSMVRLG